MNIKDVIKRAKSTAKTADERLLSERFEEYLDLLQLKKGISQEGWALLEPRIQESLISLKEVADRISISFGFDPTTMVEFFMNPMNIDPHFVSTIEGIEIGKEPAKKTRLTKRNNKKVRV